MDEDYSIHEHEINEVKGERSTYERTNEEFGENSIEHLTNYIKEKIDKLTSNFDDIRHSILELAKKIDEQQLCHRDEISQKIKERLSDKIKAGKITERWIEKCLPKEYKRKYKCEVGSDSSQKKIPPSTDQYQVQIKDEPNSPKESEDVNGSTSETEKIKELEYAQDRSTKFTPANAFGKGFKISKRKEVLLNEALKKSRMLCHVTFDNEGYLLNARPDTIMEAE